MATTRRYLRHHLALQLRRPWNRCSHHRPTRIHNHSDYLHIFLRTLNNSCPLLGLPLLPASQSHRCSNRPDLDASPDNPHDLHPLHHLNTDGNSCHAVSGVGCNSCGIELEYPKFELDPITLGRRTASIPACCRYSNTSNRS